MVYDNEKEIDVGAEMDRAGGRFRPHGKSAVTMPLWFYGLWAAVGGIGSTAVYFAWLAIRDL